LRLYGLGLPLDRKTCTWAYVQGTLEVKLSFINTIISCFKLLTGWLWWLRLFIAIWIISWSLLTTLVDTLAYCSLVMWCNRVNWNLRWCVEVYFTDVMKFQFSDSVDKFVKRTILWKLYCVNYELSITLSMCAGFLKSLIFH